jgi:hypothetical protein
MGIGEINDDAHGITTPRIFTPPLRELTPETSNGYAVIEFAEKFLHVHLFPWQKWLLIHGLELLPDAPTGSAELSPRSRARTARPRS